MALHGEALSPSVRGADAACGSTFRSIISGDARNFYVEHALFTLKRYVHV